MSSRSKEHHENKNAHGESRHEHDHQQHHHKPAEPIELTPADEAQPAENAEPEVKPADLRAQLEAKDKEIAELKDKYLRALADFENARKRIRQQSEESVRLQRESLLRD